MVLDVWATGLEKDSRLWTLDFELENWLSFLEIVTL